MIKRGGFNFTFRKRIESVRERAKEISKIEDERKRMRQEEFEEIESQGKFRRGRGE